MPGRIYNLGGYRYGFNGKENDSEVKGDGNQQDYGMRIYDPRIGKFLSVDPITNQYPELTPYQFASNRPIDGIDIDGKEWGTFKYKTYSDSKGNTHVKIITEQYLDDWLSSIGGKQLWLRPADAKPGEYGNQGIPFNSFSAMKDAAAKFGFGQADFDENYKVASDRAWQNFKVMALTDLALSANSAIDGYMSSQIARRNLAMQWMGSASKTQYINFNLNVAETNIAAGTELLQFRVKGSKGPGSFYAPKGTTPEEVGLVSSEIEATFSVKVNGDTRGLLSTHKKNATYYLDPKIKVKGGGQQIYSEELKNNATFTKIP